MCLFLTSPAVICFSFMNETSLAQPGAWEMLMIIPLVSSYQVDNITFIKAILSRKLIIVSQHHILRNHVLWRWPFPLQSWIAVWVVLLVPTLGDVEILMDMKLDFLLEFSIFRFKRMSSHFYILLWIENSNDTPIPFIF